MVRVHLSTQGLGNARTKVNGPWIWPLQSNIVALTASSDHPFFNRSPALFTTKARWIQYFMPVTQCVAPCLSLYSDSDFDGVR